MAQPIDGKVVAITGGARGIGFAIAQALSNRGARVAIGDIDEAAAKQASAQLGEHTVGLPLDASDRESFETFYSTAATALGPIDVLVNNAGVMALGNFVDEPDTVTARQVAINLTAVSYGIKIALREMSTSGGQIINIGSGSSKMGFKGAATYCATKHAVYGMSEAVRSEIQGSPIGISVIMPAVVKTELTKGVKGSTAFPHLDPSDVADAVVRTIERPRFDVFVPAKLGLFTKIIRLLPRSGMDWVAKKLGADRALADFDSAERSLYEAPTFGSKG